MRRKERRMRWRKRWPGSGRPWQHTDWLRRDYRHDDVGAGLDAKNKQQAPQGTQFHWNPISCWSEWQWHIPNTLSFHYLPTIHSSNVLCIAMHNNFSQVQIRMRLDLEYHAPSFRCASSSLRKLAVPRYESIWWTVGMYGTFGRQPRVPDLLEQTFESGYE